MNKHHPKTDGAKTPRKHPGGRPTIFSAKLGAEVITRMLTGDNGGCMSLRRVCEATDMPGITTVMTWLAKDDDRFDEFREQYARAREAHADQFFDEARQIADRPLVGKKIKRKLDSDGKVLREVETGDNIERARLQVDVRKWAAARLAPKKYGDRKIVQGDNDADPVNTVTEFTLDIGDKKIKED